MCILGGLVLEGDLTTVGDHSSLEGVLQTHLFEDRVMKLGTVRVEESASIGSEAYVLYDSRVGAGASLGDLSLIMKHETFLPGRRYRGLPAENVIELAEPPARSIAVATLSGKTLSGGSGGGTGSVRRVNPAGGGEGEKK